MTALTYPLGVLLFVVGVAVSIGLHELGHLIPGKLFDVKVTQYFVGFGRTLWSRRKGETEYGVKAIPLGGYVKLVGCCRPGPTRTRAWPAGRTPGCSRN
jgi:membrane-associated protease RseP (regulator of RpoE activity)